jgi:hypothetical protein
MVVFAFFCQGAYHDHAQHNKTPSSNIHVLGLSVEGVPDGHNNNHELWTLTATVTCCSQVMKMTWTRVLSTIG